MAAHRPLEYRVADAVHLWHGEQQQAEQDAAHGGTQPLRPWPQPVGEVLAAVQDLDERHPDPGGQQAEAGVQDQFDGRAEVEARQREERVVAERGAPDRVGGDRAEHDQAEGLGFEVAQDQLRRRSAR